MIFARTALDEYFPDVIWRKLMRDFPADRANIGLLRNTIAIIIVIPEGTCLDLGTPHPQIDPSAFF